MPKQQTTTSASTHAHINQLTGDDQQITSYNNKHSNNSQIIRPVSFWLLETIKTKTINGRSLLATHYRIDRPRGGKVRIEQVKMARKSSCTTVNAARCQFNYSSLPISLSLSHFCPHFRHTPLSLCR